MNKNKPIENKPQSGSRSRSLARPLLWVLGLALALLCVFFMVNRSTEQIAGKEVLIRIKPLPGKINFLKESDVHKMIDTLLVKAEFSKARCERVLESNPYIKKAEVYTDLKGELHCRITQRQPIVRVINQYHQQYYIDQMGTKFPVVTGTAARVLVANGRINERIGPRDSLLTPRGQDIYKVAQYIEAEVFWKQFTEQLYVDKNKDLILIPKVGSFTIVLGSSEDLEEKFSDLKTFITRALPKVGWDKYSVINAKFKDQLVTVKRKNN